MNPFELCQVADVGDVNCHPYDFDGAVDAMTAYVRELREHGVAPIAAAATT